ncbi:unnamed protein product [Didymodactylos carnosus]|uniref:Uncharacterized protein n=1 Tax=Didymodactylos carnosus TaxID=1234261 RepID=A0A813UZF7_9BILA|nr:unnamed protein product [Didymodactylos carnosus]CAF1061056.1 unnamed protein product [Didymodactylos carnosus]CAF3622098.1 unnamed protein product [Didymodactylos carnosus]CAF3826569.1 unnamed protein product [Didymodactylos carnosus]
MGRGCLLMDEKSSTNPLVSGETTYFERTMGTYIELISDIIRRLHLLLSCRSSCPVIKSCLEVIADGLEFVFDIKSINLCQVIPTLFNSDKKHFNDIDNDLNKMREQNITIISDNSQTSSADESTALLFNDENTIKCLSRLYNFYNINSEQINQHIGENHVSILLPIHHSLLQIRQLLKPIQLLSSTDHLISSTNSSNIFTDTTLI